MSPGTSTLDEQQWAEVEALASLGLGPAAVVGELATSPSFTQSEMPQAMGNDAGSGSGARGDSKSGSTKGKRHKGSGGNSGGGGNGTIGKLLPLLGKDSQLQQSNAGVPYQPGQQLNPSIVGGADPMLVIGVVAALGIGAYFLLRKKGKKK